MAKGGYILLHKKVLDNNIVMKDTEHFSIRIYLLLNASYEKNKTWFGGREIELEEGQLITGRKQISIALKVSESKIQRVLDLLSKGKQIEQQTNSEGRLITILNRSSYQNSERQMKSKGNRNVSDLNTTKRNKERKKETINKEIKVVDGNRTQTKFATPTLLEVENYILERKSRISADRFHSYYESNGWMVGKNKMKDWKSAVRNRENRDNLGPQSEQLIKTKRQSSAEYFAQQDAEKKKRELLYAHTGDLPF